MISPGTDYCSLIRGAAEQGIFDDAHGQLDGFIAEQLVHDKLAAQETEFQLADGRWMQLISEMTEDGGVIETWIDITRMKSILRA